MVNSFTKSVCKNCECYESKYECSQVAISPKRTHGGAVSWSNGGAKRSIVTTFDMLACFGFICSCFKWCDQRLKWGSVLKRFSLFQLKDCISVLVSRHFSFKIIGKKVNRSDMDHKIRKGRTDTPWTMG
jgi:hypothetical protein